VFCSTDGLTQLTATWPDSTSDNSADATLARLVEAAEPTATCAVSVTFSMPSIGLLCEGCSVSSTSSAACAIQPSCSP